MTAVDIFETKVRLAKSRSEILLVKHPKDMSYEKCIDLKANRMGLHPSTVKNMLDAYTEMKRINRERNLPETF